MSIALDIAMAVAGGLLMALGAHWIVVGAAHVARRMGVSELVIGLTLVAFGTSAPEMAVTIDAALNGYSDISVANIVGSNIFNLGFILGAVSLVAVLITSRTLVVREGGMLVGSTVLLLWLLRDLRLERSEGVVLLVVLALYIGLLWWRGEAPAVEGEVAEGSFNMWDVPRLLAGLATVVAGGHLLVEGGVSLARDMGMSEWVIGVTIVAAGTSAPELATSLTAALRGRHGISAGNLIGSDLYNMLGVLGIAALLRPMEVDPSARIDLWVLLGMVVVVLVLMRVGWRLTRRDGALLLMLGAARWAMTFAG